MRGKPARLGPDDVIHRILGPQWTWAPADPLKTFRFLLRWKNTDVYHAVESSDDSGRICVVTWCNGCGFAHVLESVAISTLQELDDRRGWKKAFPEWDFVPAIKGGYRQWQKWMTF